tara:strand:- start:2502 stop:3932 length:1431 start_codon:yes stop_codon:yes gene_type:complete
MHKYSAVKLASFSTVRYLSFFILMLRGFMVASILGKEAFGLYSIVIILQQQFSLFGLGVRESVSLQLANSSLNDGRFSEISVTAFWFAVSVIVVLTFISGIMSELFNIWDYETYNLHMALRLAAFTIGTEILANIARARGMLGTVMIGEFGYAALSFLLFWIVSRSFSLADAFLYALLASNIIVFCYYAMMHKDLFSTATFSFADAKQLVALGIPILIQNTFAVFLYSAGHYYLRLSADIEQLSIYSFAFSLAIAAQIGVQSVLWAKFSEMLTLFGKDDGSVAAKQAVTAFAAQVTEASRAFLVLSIIALKLFLVFFVSQFFPEFILSVPMVVVIFMALYWPILAISEATLLLAKKRFGKLYLSSGAGIFVLGLLLIIYGLHGDVFGTFGRGNITAFAICGANFIFYCMLKFHGGRALGYTVRGTLFDILKTLAFVCILASCYYSKGLLLPVLVMMVMLLFVARRSMFKIGALSNF